MFIIILLSIIGFLAKIVITIDIASSIGLSYYKDKIPKKKIYIKIIFIPFYWYYYYFKRFFDKLD